MFRTDRTEERQAALKQFFPQRKQNNTNYKMDSGMWIGYSMHMNVKAKAKAEKQRKKVQAEATNPHEFWIGSRRVSKEEKVELLLKSLKINNNPDDAGHSYTSAAINGLDTSEDHCNNFRPDSAITFNSVPDIPSTSTSNEHVLPPGRSYASSFGGRSYKEQNTTNAASASFKEFTRCKIAVISVEKQGEVYVYTVQVSNLQGSPTRYLHRTHHDFWVLHRNLLDFEEMTGTRRLPFLEAPMESGTAVSITKALVTKTMLSNYTLILSGIVSCVDSKSYDAISAFLGINEAQDDYVSDISVRIYEQSVLDTRMRFLSMCRQRERSVNMAEVVSCLENGEKIWYVDELDRWFTVGDMKVVWMLCKCSARVDLYMESM